QKERMPTLDSKVRDHVRKEEIIPALALLKEHLPTLSTIFKNKRNMILLLESQWNGNENKFLSGLRSEESYKREVARIKLAVITQIPSNATQIELEEEESDPTTVDQPPRVSPLPEFGNKKVYFSYSWENDKNPGIEGIVNEMYKSLIAEGFPIIRDKVDLDFGSSIDKFMKKLAEGDLVMIFVSDKYIRSDYSMFELYKIGLNNGMDYEKVINKILPVRVEEKLDFGPSGFREYREHWESMRKEWWKNVKSGKASKYESDRYYRVKDIEERVGDLLGWIVDINSKTTQLLKENNFEEVKAAIRSRLTS
ncbi:MAG: TIR domain-containing protein, partial [Bacteroidota bacterium]